VNPGKLSNEIFFPGRLKRHDSVLPTCRESPGVEVMALEGVGDAAGRLISLVDLTAA